MKKLVVIVFSSIFCLLLGLLIYFYKDQIYLRLNKSIVFDVSSDYPQFELKYDKKLFDQFITENNIKDILNKDGAFDYSSGMKVKPQKIVINLTNEKQLQEKFNRKTDDNKVEMRSYGTRYDSDSGIYYLDVFINMDELFPQKKDALDNKTVLNIYLLQGVYFISANSLVDSGQLSVGLQEKFDEIANNVINNKTLIFNVVTKSGIRELIDRLTANLVGEVWADWWCDTVSEKDCYVSQTDYICTNSAYTYNCDGRCSGYCLGYPGSGSCVCTSSCDYYQSAGCDGSCNPQLCGVTTCAVVGTASCEWRCSPTRPVNTCGTDDCGWFYDNCSSGYHCSGGSCVPDCNPSCNGINCGANTDGCGGSCGCNAGYSCRSGSCCQNVTADISVNTTPVNMCSGYTVSWTSTGATSCTVNSVGYGASGSITDTKYSPGTYTYSLTCSNACGNSATDTVSVSVNSMTASISATPANPYMCQNYTVSWSSTGGANSCTVSGAGSATGGGSGSFVDNKNVIGSYTYNLSCTNSACLSPITVATATTTVNVQNISCSIVSLTTSPISFSSIRVGESTIATAVTSVSPAGAPPVDRVLFQVPPSGTSIARVCDAATPGLCGGGEDNEFTDLTAAPFSANVSIVNSNYLSATLNARAYIGACLPVEKFCDLALPSQITVDYKLGWFQVRGGNVVSRTGNVQSIIPATATDNNAATLDDKYFIKDPVALLIYSLSGAYDFDSASTTGRVSTTDISASTDLTFRPDSSFDLYFNKRLPDDVRTSMTTILPSTVTSITLSTCTKVRGYKVCYYNGADSGDLQLTGDYLIADTDRIVLFVDNAKTIIKGKIKPQNRGRSSFLLISEGDIMVDPSVGGSPDIDTDLEGIFYTDGVFDSGSWR